MIDILIILISIGNIVISTAVYYNVTQNKTINNVKPIPQEKKEILKAELIDAETVEEYEDRIKIESLPENIRIQILDEEKNRLR